MKNIYCTILPKALHRLNTTAYSAYLSHSPGTPALSFYASHCARRTPNRMDDFDTLVPHYERELALLRQGMARFEREFPAAAVRLSLSDGLSGDPSVGRMMQGAAWLYARTSRRIGDHVPEFTEAMLETVFPAYLRSVPSCSIARFDVSRLFEDRTRTFTVPRGTELASRPSQCRFAAASRPKYPPSRSQERP